MICLGKSEVAWAIFDFFRPEDRVGLPGEAHLEKCDLAAASFRLGHFLFWFGKAELEAKKDVTFQVQGVWLSEGRISCLV